MVFTPEMRAKGLAVRQANAAKRRLEKVTKRAPKPPVPKTNGDVVLQLSEAELNLPHTVTVAPVPFDWLTSPIPVIQERLADLEREYKRASQIVLSRTSRLPQTWTCWSQSNKSIVPKSVLSQCRGNVVDGKWVSRDDGHKDKDGRLSPIVTCSMLCHEVYLKNKPVGGLGRR